MPNEDLWKEVHLVHGGSTGWTSSYGFVDCCFKGTDKVLDVIVQFWICMQCKVIKKKIKILSMWLICNCT